MPFDPSPPERPSARRFVITWLGIGVLLPTIAF